MKKVCESCQAAAASIIEELEGEQPYYVCKPCYERLVSLSLRPSEWYNLSVIHSPYAYYLHDDFYEEDGEACQPEGEVEDEDQYPAPTLEDVEETLEDLIDYTLTRWWLEQEVIEALKKHSPSSLLKSIKERYNRTENYNLRSRYYEVVAGVLEKDAQDWIRERWKAFDETYIIELSEAAAVCLPFDEGFGLVRDVLKNMQSKPKPALFFSCLYRFQSVSMLTVIEEEIDVFDEGWGSLAASASPSWEIMKKWLASGRPLSLVALDTMRKCVPGLNDGVLKEINPCIIEAPSFEEINETLQSYLEEDPVPRVQKDTEYILQNHRLIFKNIL